MRKTMPGGGFPREAPSPMYTPMCSSGNSMFPVISLSSDDDAWNDPTVQPEVVCYGVSSLQGKRPYQEDDFAIRLFLGAGSATNIDPKSQRPVITHFFGLFDGHAGGRCSKYISSTLPNVLVEDSLFISNLPLALKRSFHTANDLFLKIAESERLHDGSTGICSIIRNGKLLVGNVGDCRCLLLSGGKPIQMSIDQKPTNPDEIKRIISLGGTITNNLGVARVNGILAVSRAFGNRKLRKVIRPDIEMMQRDLSREDDFLIMASDGLWDVLRNKDVCDIAYSLAASQRVQQIAEELVHAAIARGSMDNVTCIVVNLADLKAEKPPSNFHGANRVPYRQLSYMDQEMGPASGGLSSPMQMRGSLFPRGPSPGQGPGPGQGSGPPSAGQGQRDSEGFSAFSTSAHNAIQRINSSNVGSGMNRASSFTMQSTSSLHGVSGAGHGHPSHDNRNSKSNFGNNFGEEGRSHSMPIWGSGGPDGLGAAVRPWTGSGAPQHAQSAAMQGRQSPTTPSGPVHFDRGYNQYDTSSQTSAHTAYNQNQHYQVAGGHFHASASASRDDSREGINRERVDSDIDDPHTAIIRPSPKPAAGLPKGIPASRFQPSPQFANFIVMPNHDPRSGFVPTRETGGKAPGAVPGSRSARNNSRASSASAASVRHTQSMNAMPKLFAKAASSDSLASQALPQRSETEAAFAHPDNSFSAIASSSLPANFGGINPAGLVTGPGMRPLNSPIAFLTAAAEKQRSASTGQNLPPSRQSVGAIAAGISSDRGRVSPTTSSRKVSQMRIAYA